jgi:hypothetical protein
MAVILSWDPGTIGHCFGIARVHNIRSFLVATWREDRINIYIGYILERYALRKVVPSPYY